MLGAGGAITGKMSGVSIVIPDEPPGEDMPALASAGARASLQFSRGVSRLPDWQQQQRLHPGYRVIVDAGRMNADFEPAGKVFYIYAEVVSGASKIDSERLFHIDLSCFARRRACSQQDLMPEAFEQYETDSRASQAPAIQKN